MNVVIDIPGADPQGRVFLTWTPVQATARVVNGGGAGTTNVTLRSAGTGGGLVFDTTRSHQGQESLPISLSGDGTAAPFWIAGEFGKPSSEYADAVVQAVDDNSGSVLGSKAVMVRVRKDAQTLGAAERDRFLAALGTLNGQGQGAYKDFREMHLDATTREMHGNVGFPPWHRAYVLDLERALQNIDPTVTVPYWRFDQPAPDVFTSTFMGEDGGAGLVQLTPGHPLEHWWTDGQLGIVRQLLFPSNGPARVISELATLRLGKTYDPFQTDPRKRFELNPHGAAHTSFSGPISVIDTAVRDPLFFMLHANVDRLWAKWQWVYHHTAFTDPGAYAPPSPPRIGHNLGDTMWPWNGITTSPRPSTAPGGPFPRSPVVPAPSPQPKVQDMFDYQAVGGGDHLGFAYDDVPFQLPPTVIAGPGSVVRTAAVGQP
jgi:tyrosinase